MVTDAGLVECVGKLGDALVRMGEDAERSTAASPRRVDRLGDGGDSAVLVDAGADEQSAVDYCVTHRRLVEAASPNCGGQGWDRTRGVSVRRGLEFDDSVR
jgi:hypothetical protein